MASSLPIPYKVPGSHEQSGDPPSETQRWQVETHDPSTASLLILAYTPSIIPSTYGALYRALPTVHEEGHGIYSATLKYTARRRENGTYNLRVSTRGGTLKQTHATRVASFARDGFTPPNNGELININKEGVAEGVDLPSSELTFTVDFSWEGGIIDREYMTNLMLESFKPFSNSTSFMGVDPHQVLFLGFTGQEGTDTQTQISYDFLFSKNETNLVIGDVTVSSKRGWDVVSVYSSETEDEGQPSAQIDYVDVHRPIEYKDMAAILGFGDS